MFIFRTIDPLKLLLQQKREQGLIIGFVPTMGALHEGHISLIKQCKATTDITVCSIFVNPVQFNDKRDFEQYPQTPENDLSLLEEEGCDIVFMPTVEEIYPKGNIQKEYAIGRLSELWEGAYRPGHFQGVCKVIDRLLSIIEPQKLYMGQKDYQQIQIIKKLMTLPSVFRSELVMCPIKRMETGLALSSRNSRLNNEKRNEANALYKILKETSEIIKSSQGKQLDDVFNMAEKKLLQNGFDKVDYLALADADNLESLNKVTISQKSVLLCAAYIGGVRLIDNILLTIN